MSVSKLGLRGNSACRLCRLGEVAGPLRSETETGAANSDGTLHKLFDSSIRGNAVITVLAPSIFCLETVRSAKLRDHQYGEMLRPEIG